MMRKFGSSMKIAAASSVMEDVLRDGKQDNKPEIIESKHKDFLYFRSRAISAGDQGPVKGEPNPNGNGDYFPRTELESSYKTFENRNLFLNHESDHPVKSVGKIISAEAIEDPETGEFYIECLAKIDRKLHPEIARKIETGELNTVSMGCSCEESVCSICGTQVFSDEDEKCQHLNPAGLGKMYTAETEMPEFGIIIGQPTMAFSINRGLNFNELSIVSVPADEQAIIKTVLANAKNSLSKNASITEADRVNIVSQVEKILEKLDPETKQKIKDEIFANHTSREDSKMAGKGTSKSEDFNNKEVYKLSEEDHVNMILEEKLSALEHIRLLNSYEKKRKKAEAEPKKEDTSETNLVERIANKVKAMIFSKTKKAKTVKKADPKPQPKISAKFIKNDDVKKSAWVIYNGKIKLIEATLGNLWDEKDLKNEKFLTEKTSELYGKALVSRYSEIGHVKMSKLLGLAYSKTDVKDSKVKEPAKNQFLKPGEKSSADKEHDKSVKAIDEKDESKVGEHLEKHEESIKKNKEASADKCKECGKDKPKDKLLCSVCFDKKIEKKNKEAGHKEDCDCNFCKKVLKKDDKPEDKKDDKEETSKKEAMDDDIVNDADLDKESGKNDSVIQAFITQSDPKARSTNLHIMPSDEGWDLINYQTVIAKHMGDKILLDNRSYSVTTSKIQNQVAAAAKAAGIPIADMHSSEDVHDPTYKKPTEKPEFERFPVGSKKDKVEKKAGKTCVHKNVKKGSKCPNCGVQLDDKIVHPKKTFTPDSSVDKDSKEAATEIAPPERTEQLPDEKPETGDEVTVEEPEVAPDVKMPAQDKPESAFDKIDQPIIIGDGFEAEKDKETGEIVVSKDGEEIQRMPDAFSTEVADIMKLLQSILGVQTEEELPGSDEPAKRHDERPEDKGPEVEEIIEEPEMAMDPMAASKKDTINKEASEKISKKAAELKVKEDKLLKKEKELTAQEEKVKAHKFSSVVNVRFERCKKVVRAMLDKDLLELDENTITAALDQGENIIDARQTGLKHAINKQVRELMALDDLMLESFEKSIKNVKTKKVANRLTTPLSISYEEVNSVDTELQSIFDSMGSQGGRNKFQ